MWTIHDSGAASLRLPIRSLSMFHRVRHSATLNSQWFIIEIEINDEFFSSVIRHTRCTAAHTQKERIHGRCFSTHTRNELTTTTTNILLLSTFDGWTLHMSKHTKEQKFIYLVVFNARDYVWFGASYANMCSRVGKTLNIMIKYVFRILLFRAVPLYV